MSETNPAFQAFLDIKCMDDQQAWIDTYLSDEMRTQYVEAHNDITNYLRAQARPGQKLRINSRTGVADFTSDIEGEGIISGQYVAFELTMLPEGEEKFRLCLVFNDEGVVFRQFTITDETIETFVKTN